MSDLINRKALRLMKVKECAGHSIEYAEGWKACIEWIKTLPSAEPELKKGEGIEYPDCLGYEDAYSDDHIVCSVCGHVYSICNNCTEEFDFCPHCGADMRGE